MSDDISSSLEVYNDLLNIEYHFIIARKAQTIDIKLRFTKSEFFHLAGLQYLKDIADLKSDRTKIYDKLLNDVGFKTKVLNSSKYKDITERVAFVADLENFLDSNETIFKFNNKANTFSLITSDYILKNYNEHKNMYVFISEYENSPGTFFCRSAFPRDKELADYTKGHTSFKLLFKEKRYIITNAVDILYIAPSYRKQWNMLNASQINQNTLFFPPESPTQKLPEYTDWAETAISACEEHAQQREAEQEASVLK